MALDAEVWNANGQRFQSKFNSLVTHYRFNFNVDTLFLTTNATEWNGGQEVLPLDDLPVDIEKAKCLSIGWGLWQGWNFAQNFGVDVSCDYCHGWGSDNS